MGGSLEAFKLFLGSEKKRSDRADERLRQQQVNETTVEPTSDSILADQSKTEIHPATPATVPAKVAAVASQPATSDFATVADAEAGASLNQIIPTAREASVQS